jgi:hypothetical protein
MLLLLAHQQLLSLTATLQLLQQTLTLSDQAIEHTHIMEQPEQFLPVLVKVELSSELDIPIQPIQQLLHAKIATWLL